MSKGLSSPKGFLPHESAVETILEKLEAALKERGGVFDKPVDLQSGVNTVTVRIDGHYDLADCQEVCRQYREAGWDSLIHKRVGKQTTFVFRASKS